MKKNLRFLGSFVILQTWKNSFCLFWKGTKNVVARAKAESWQKLGNSGGRDLFLKIFGDFSASAEEEEKKINLCQERVLVIVV